MSAIELALWAGLAASVVAYSLSLVALNRIRRPWTRAMPLPALSPPVSILKPLCGTDDELEENLESFFRLDYPSYEVVFSFTGREDPAYPVTRRVADRHPAVPSTFVFDPREPGGNAKVNRLGAAQRHARHRLLWLADGNVRVRPDCLSRAVARFADPRVGLVSHLFRARGAVTVGSRLESLHLNGCLLPGTAAIAEWLRMPCVVGKSILISRDALDAIGGFGRLRDFLAEDYLLGREIRRAGYRVVLFGDVIETSEARRGLSAVWSRQRRWAVMRRRLAGPLYAGELLTGAAPWCAALMFVSSPSGRAAALALLALRYAVELWDADRSGAAVRVRDWALLPVRDAGALLLFVAGLTGRAVSWRGRALRVGRQTAIRPVNV